MTTSRQPAPSGAQYRISHGDQRATVVEVGAAVREYAIGDREIFQSYPEQDVSWGFHASVLLPWPNRLRDGQYDFDGTHYQVSLTEPALRNALHGLAAWLPWALVEHSAGCVSLRCRLMPSPGYPFQLDTVVRYELGDTGLVVTTTSTNVGAAACPYGLGFHPYISTGVDTLLDGCTLQIDADRRLLVDERLIPIGDEPVAGTAYDFRTATALAGVVLDDAFAGVLADRDGVSRVRVGSADGHTVEVWADAHFEYWQVYSGEHLPAHLKGRSLAVEPMTAAPNAFQSGAGLRRLEPGESITTRWGARLS